MFKREGTAEGLGENVATWGWEAGTAVLQRWQVTSVCLKYPKRDARARSSK